MSTTTPAAAPNRVAHAAPWRPMRVAYWIAGTLAVTEPGEMLVYYEGSGKPTPRQLGLTVSGPDGARVSLKTYELKLQYDAAGARGVASAVASFQATSAGSYQVSATDSSRGRARLAVGENIGRGLASALLWPGLLVLATVSVSTAIAVADRSAPLTPFAMPQYKVKARADAARLDAAPNGFAAKVLRNIQRASKYCSASSCSRRHRSSGA